jgi:hypothetical protein
MNTLTLTINHVGIAKSSLEKIGTCPQSMLTPKNEVIAFGRQDV